jgi:hypothetical protein
MPRFAPSCGGYERSTTRSVGRIATTISARSAGASWMRSVRYGRASSPPSVPISANRRLSANPKE